jgi:hypothetical protein
MSVKNPSNIHAFVASGLDLGAIIYPHRYSDGRFVVSMTRFKKDYIYVDSPSELLDWLEKGYRLRMSNVQNGVVSPRLVKPENIYRPVII